MSTVLRSLAPAEGVNREGLFVDRIGKSFRGRAVVKSVSLRLGRGEVAGLLGPNGAGKTTCFYMITGLVAADYGAIYLDGEDITALPMYQRARLGVGYLPQETSIFRGMTVEQNIAAVVEMREPDAARPPRPPSACWRSCASRTCATRRRSRCRAASGGAARSPAPWPASPPSCCWTSPSPASTPWRSPTSARWSSYLKTRGIGVLITDHNVRETLGIIDRASSSHDGEVLFEGKPEEILANPEVRRVYLGDRFD